MLVLTRKTGERILIGKSITLTVLKCKSGRVRLGIDAPAAVDIRRTEVASRSGDQSRVRPSLVNRRE
jgi:carbon storage regulator